MYASPLSKVLSTSLSFFFGSKLLSRGDGVLEHRLGLHRSIDRDSVSDVVRWPGCLRLRLLVHLRLHHVATGVHSSKATPPPYPRRISWGHRFSFSEVFFFNGSSLIFLRPLYFYDLSLVTEIGI
jgi:hypothetical protein